jgi:hypothetical protein
LLEIVKQVYGRDWKEKIYVSLERQRGVDAEKDSIDDRELAGCEC